MVSLDLTYQIDIMIMPWKHSKLDPTLKSRMDMTSLYSGLKRTYTVSVCEKIHMQV